VSRRVTVLTGTRADFGKQKSLMLALQEHPDFELEVFVTGMHLLRQYGSTVEEIRKSGIRGLHRYSNQIAGEPMDLALSNTVAGLARHVHESPPDLIVVHGDRIEALAGAIVGSFRNIRTAHIEGGEVSGTIDGSIRHAITKLVHVHFAANDAARDRLRQLGEDDEHIFVVGSPEVDVMLSDRLPGIDEVRRYYELPDVPLGIVAYHPVTTELDRLRHQADQLVDALLETDGHFVVIDPNNDEGTTDIAVAFERLRDHDRFHRFPSLRFESYLTLLKHAELLVGNSSSGVREAPVFGTPSIDLGSRQQGRADSDSILHCVAERGAILAAIAEARRRGRTTPNLTFGAGSTTSEIVRVLEGDDLWQLPLEKVFQDR
jgi:UDP-N-acetylglucosamine 2-epimerase (hydrolysing)